MRRTTFALSYGLSFASITATVRRHSCISTEISHPEATSHLPPYLPQIVHALLYFRKPIRVHLSRSLGEQPDVHAQLMARYRNGACTLSHCIRASFWSLL